ncbi:hypothetical protein, partial [Salmonella enterica]|uniref:hypothetical protein n=1 Tax=Salmonella enterica TaxID=28901 RepID=UPI003F4BA2B8
RVGLSRLQHDAVASACCSGGCAAAGVGVGSGASACRLRPDTGGRQQHRAQQGAEASAGLHTTLQRGN